MMRSAIIWIRSVLPSVGVFVAVLVLDLALVAAAGTDIPFYDAWDVEGRWLYPTWVDGTLPLGELARAHNEHRILWTNLLNLALFELNGQWDPLVQLVAIAVLRASVAAGLAWALGCGRGFAVRIAIGMGIAVAFVPVAAWHNALWGFQSQVLFAVGFSIAALALLSRREMPPIVAVVGVLSGIAGLLAMAPAALVPAALLGLAVLRSLETRTLRARDWWPALVLLVVAMALRASTAEHSDLEAASMGEFLGALGRALAWPHTSQPLAAIVMNGPLLLVIAARISRQRTGIWGEDYVIALGAWAAAVAAAAAWVRGGGAEWMAGVPSRYVDFLVLLPVANAWCAVALAKSSVARWLSSAKWLAWAWCLFLAVGWLGLSAEMMRGVILPRARDREAPARLAVAFQRSGDASVFSGQPRLLIPHPNLESVRAVLNDPRMRGRLPPSFQPERPLGRLSRGVRALLWFQ